MCGEDEARFQRRASCRSRAAEGRWERTGLLALYLCLLSCLPSSCAALQVVSDARSRASNGCLAFISDRMLNLNRWAGLTEDEARFYIACVVLGLEGMHAKGLLHR